MTTRSNVKVLSADVISAVFPHRKVSPRTGRMPISAENYRRELANPAVKHRMEVAREKLAAEIGDGMPTLSKLRLQKGLSQARLAAAIGTSQSHIAKIESGAVEMQWSTVIKLSDALAVSLEELRCAIPPSKTVNSKSENPILKSYEI